MLRTSPATGVSNKKGFTLLELIIVITILGVLSALVSGNFLISLQRGRDAHRKEDLNQTQRGLELYYEDSRTYPLTNIFNSTQLCHPSGCDTRTYITKISDDPSTSAGYKYYYESDGTFYKLYSCIENTQDQGSGVLQSGYVGTNCGACGTCKYKMTSSNTN